MTFYWTGQNFIKVCPLEEKCMIHFYNIFIVLRCGIAHRAFVQIVSFTSRDQLQYFNKSTKSIRTVPP